MNTIDRIKKAIKEGNFKIGYNTTVKALKNGKAELVVIANNAPEGVKKEIENLGKVAKSEVEVFEKSNIELGATCKKPFGVMLVAVTREKK
ncbi:50S ribosomal protein L30e [Candidatus Tiddalikarchaeum anstoanum]|nr:50S ribosomal protein L30e [Candidatus Tiddalikarchaeum anstoanum]